MKTNMLYFAVTLLFLSACQDNTTQSQVDLKAEKELVKKTISNFYAYAEERNIEAFKSLITDDAVAVGSDPSEVWNKDEIIKIFKEMMEMDQMDIKSVGDAVLYVSPDGMSAIAIQHFSVPITSNIRWRHMFYLRKVENQWLITCWSASLAPDNADLEKMNNALDAAEINQ